VRAAALDVRRSAGEAISVIVPVLNERRVLPRQLAPAANVEVAQAAIANGPTFLSLKRLASTI
jgi:hypothetical protein